MNEEAIKIAYDLFVADGYKKSIDEFKSLMQGDPKGREVAYNLFVADGYKKPINEFEVLMGVTAPSDLTKKEAPKPTFMDTIKKKISPSPSPSLSGSEIELVVVDNKVND